MSLLRISNSFERLPDANLQVTASSIVDAITNNPAFPNPMPDLPTVTAALDGFATALTKAQDGAHSDIATKNQKRTELINVLHRLGDYVVFAAGGDEVKAASSGFSFAKERANHATLEKPESLVLSDGDNPGELHLSFRRVKDASSYVYQITPDPLTETSDWQSHNGTVAQANFSKLERGKRYWCRVGAIGINEQTIYSEAVCRIVQ
jgi:hypothetical protein